MKSTDCLVIRNEGTYYYEIELGGHGGGSETGWTEDIHRAKRFRVCDGWGDHSPAYWVHPNQFKMPLLAVMVLVTFTETAEERI